MDQMRSGTATDGHLERVLKKSRRGPAIPAAPPSRRRAKVYAARRIWLSAFLIILLGTISAAESHRAATLLMAAGSAEFVGFPIFSERRQMTEDNYTLVTQVIPSPPRWFTGADHRVHLVYELLLTNTVTLPVTVSQVEVLDAGRGTTVATLADTELTTAISSLAGDELVAATLPPSTVGVVWFDLPFANRTEVPASVEHLVTLALPEGTDLPPTITATGGRAEIDQRPPVVLAPPLLGPHWLAAGSCCDGPHRRAFQSINSGLYLSQRFAIDFNLLDAQGRIAVEPLSVNTNHAGYGQPVIAVADATVVTAVDRFPDQIEGDHYPLTIENTPGNHIVLDLGEGRFAFYAHLRPGTVAVRVGERVRRGQQIGELGNSGGSHGAHLHFHVMDGPSPLAADGLPYAFDAFVLTGHGPPLAEIGALYEGGLPLPIDARDTGPRQDALPLGGDVVTFPGNLEAGGA